MVLNKYKPKIVLWKYYFDKGFGLLNHLKYVIALFALYEVVNLNDIKITVVLGITWVIACMYIGRWWYKKDWNAIELEVQNQIDPFVREMREKFK